MSIQAAMTGARLAYVVKKLPGTVMRDKVVFDEVPAGRHKDGTKRVMNKMKREPREVPAGNLVYFPRGHVLRLSDAELAKYHLDKKPKMINIQGLNDPNSAIGMLLMQQDADSRAEAYTELEKQVIQIATAKSGPVQMPEQLDQMRANVARRRKDVDAPAA